MLDLSAAPRVLVLGAYGLIGSGVVGELRAQGCQVIGFGRSEKSALRAQGDIEWRFGDLRDFKSVRDWETTLQGVDFVVNAAGALQDGPEDDLQAVHVTAVRALATLCAVQGVGLIQISAVGATLDASTAFMRTKAQGDEAVAQSGGDTWILRPGLVLAETGYGGTALLRMLAAVPLVQPLALAGARIQTVGVQDLARAVYACVDGSIPSGLDADLVEAEDQSLSHLTAQMRGWLGFEPARFAVPLPDVTLAPVGYIADLLGRLGWRSPLRSNALKTLEAGVVGNPEAWLNASGTPMGSLAQTLSSMPARSEDRISARAHLLMPICVATLAVFWLLSGVIGLAQLPAAAQTLIDVGWPQSLARLSVGSWALVDIALAATLLWRKTARMACISLAGVCVIYLVSATLVTPFLWLDPLGPLVKIFPALTLSLVTLALLDKR